MSAAKLVDPKSWELADHFLEPAASDADRQALAAAIQQAVEDWFEQRDRAETGLARIRDVAKEVKP